MVMSRGWGVGGPSNREYDVNLSTNEMRSYKQCQFAFGEFSLSDKDELNVDYPFDNDPWRVLDRKSGTDFPVVVRGALKRVFF
jgi:hypothetical protein